MEGTPDLSRLLPEYGSNASIDVTYPDGKRLINSSPRNGGGEGPILFPPRVDAQSKPVPIWKKNWNCMGVVAAVDGIWVARETTVPDAAQRTFALTAVKLEDGSILWEQPLPASPVKNAIAMDSVGRLFVSLIDGRILCFVKD